MFKVKGGEDEVFGLPIDCLGQILLRFLEPGIGDGALEVKTILAPHGAAHMIHRLHDDLAAVTENQLINY